MNFILSLSFSMSRLIELGRFLCWGSETVIHMQGIRQRNMMIWRWNICHMCSSCLLHAPLFIHSSMSATRAGILGFSLPSQAVCICLVSFFFCLLIIFNTTSLIILKFHNNLSCVYCTSHTLGNGKTNKSIQAFFVLWIVFPYIICVFVFTFN